MIFRADCQSQFQHNNFETGIPNLDWHDRASVSSTIARVMFGPP